MILVTGGVGYIGSHTVVELLAAGHEVLVLDNLSNSKISVIDRIARIAGRAPQFIKADILDRGVLDDIFKTHRIEAVIHFAGLKAVGESVAEPLHYYQNNVAGTLVLLQAMAAAGVKQIVFSSSATVYGEPDVVPVNEAAPYRPASPYGRSKRMVEELLFDLYAADPEWRIGVLRYFNPVGAHPSALIGEDPNGVPNNLMPFVTQVAVGLRAELSIFGDDYPTPDGTGIRDYIHVVDLALGHLAALTALSEAPACLIANLGTGQGYSVKQVIEAFEKASGKRIPVKVTGRRPGDVPCYFADPAYAQTRLGWAAQRGLDDICRDAWHWQTWAAVHPEAL